MEFKELTLEELTRGYVWSEEEQLYQCIFCGDKFEEGLIYSSRGKSVNALRAMQEHIFDEHGSVFECLLDLDKQMNGLCANVSNRYRTWRISANHTLIRSLEHICSIRFLRSIILNNYGTDFCSKGR